MPDPRISLIIPTQRRLQGLATAVRSTFRQKDVDRSELELVIVDNDSRGGHEQRGPARIGGGSDQHVAGLQLARIAGR